MRIHQKVPVVYWYLRTFPLIAHPRNVTEIASDQYLSLWFFELCWAIKVVNIVPLQFFQRLNDRETNARSFMRKQIVNTSERCYSYSHFEAVTEFYMNAILFKPLLMLIWLITYLLSITKQFSRTFLFLCSIFQRVVCDRDGTPLVVEDIGPKNYSLKA